MSLHDWNTLQVRIFKKHRLDPRKVAWLIGNYKYVDYNRVTIREIINMLKVTGAI